MMWGEGVGWSGEGGVARIAGTAGGGGEKGGVLPKRLKC